MYNYFQNKKAVVGKHGPPEDQVDRPRIYGFSGYRLIRVSQKNLILSSGINFNKKAVVGKHDPMDRPRIYGFSGYRLPNNITEKPCFIKWY